MDDTFIIRKFTDLQIINHNKVLGRGSFGEVKEGLINGTKVAVKIIFSQSTCSNEDADKELNTMAQLRHRNVVKLIGIIDIDFEIEPKLIFEYVENGSLTRFVSSQARSEETLMHICHDIASGMAYLHDMQIIHRDLAARNVLVDSKERAKVADFGLSRFIDLEASPQNYYYKINEHKPLPFRWVPKESIQAVISGGDNEGKFSFSSDVWSFGVTLYEAWSSGAVPYQKDGKMMNNQDVLKAIDVGKNPNCFDKPKNAPAEILEVMNEIFKVDRKQRPKFSQLKVKFETLCEADKFSKMSIGKEHQKFIKTLKDAGRIKSSKVENYMLEVDRGKYVNSSPYVDKPRPIGCNVNISAPHMHAIMLDAIGDKLKPGGRALDIGSGSGYITVCLALMVGAKGQVYGIEHMTDLYYQSLENIKSDKPHLLEKGIIKMVVGDGRKGYSEGGPYDLIHIGAALEKLPNDIISQLKEGGRIVAPIGPTDGQKLKTIDKINGKFIEKDVCGVVFSLLTSQSQQLVK